VSRCPVPPTFDPSTALLYSEDEGRIEKFQPYAVPSASWLDRVGQLARSSTSNAISNGSAPRAG
jgi:hypothetical protein